MCLFLAEQFRIDARLVGLLYSILISMAWQFKSIKQQQQQHQQHHEDLQHRRGYMKPTTYVQLRKLRQTTPYSSASAGLKLTRVLMSEWVNNKSSHQITTAQILPRMKFGSSMYLKNNSNFCSILLLLFYLFFFFVIGSFQKLQK